MKIAYCGTLGHSYNITCVLDAIRSMSDEGRKKLHFIVMGDGPKMSEFVQKAEGLPVTFTGRLTYPEMVWLLSRCDIAVNPISKGAAQSIINKHMDYAMAGIPVINTQECAEYRDLITEYNAGINCECENIGEVTNAINTLINNGILRKQMGQGNRRMAKEKIDRAISCSKLIDVIIEPK